MIQEKYTPQRSCIVCRRKTAQSELIRIVRTKDGPVLFKGRHLDGRSVYICRQQKCLDIAFDKNLIAKRLGIKAETPELAEIKKEIQI